MRVLNIFSCAIFLLCFVELTGCGLQPETQTPAATFSPLSITGSVHGGQQPVSGASIQLYTVGATGDGSASTPLLTQTVTSDTGGNFNITGLYSCTSATLVYLTATGGNPGLGANNPNLALMAALGPCSSLSAATFISVNEVTTVAAVNALAPFMVSLSSIGSGTNDAASLFAAFTLAGEFANMATGTSPGNNVPSGVTIPSALINNLADVIAACVNSSGGTYSTPSICGELFSWTTPGNSTPPSNTVAALLNLANNPTLNTNLLFGLTPSTPPFQPSLSSVPSDYRIRPVYPGAAPLQLSPAQITFPIGTVGVASSSQPITIQNATSAAISLTALSFTGANASDFSQTNNCTMPLGPNASCTVQVTFTPAASGPRIGYLSISSNTSFSPQFVTLTNNNSVPSISSLSIPYIPAGGSSPINLYIAGSNFIPASVVQVNGVNRLTGYYSGSYLFFQLTAADQANPGTLPITVVNPAPGGGPSNLLNFTVTAAPSTPVISKVSPTQFTAGSISTTIYVYGSGMVAGNTVQWNGTNLATSLYYSSANGYYLGATVPASLLTTAGTANITVNNPSTSPSTSSPVAVTIVNPPAPTLTSLSTNLLPLATATTVQIYGTNFTPSSTVALNGVTIASTYGSATQMTATVPASSVALPGVESLIVSNVSGTTAPQYLTAYVPIMNNSMVYNPANGLFYLSVPSAAGTPYGNTIVSVDPVTGALGTPIPVGSEPNRLAITSDGHYLWVALDGAAAVRQVDLFAGTAGMQFPLSTGGYSPATVSALAALPGAPNSVVVATYYTGYTEATGNTLAIYDNGVPRGAYVSFGTYATFPYALIVDGTTNEIYGPGTVIPGTYSTYSYNASGVTTKSSTSSSLTYAANLTDDVAVVGGKMYTDYGQVVNPETGALLGTFYSSGTTAAQGSIAIDTTLGKAFILEGSPNFTSGVSSFQLGSFNLRDLSPTSATPIPVYVSALRASYQYQGPTGERLTRWGSNGLAFRGTGGFVSLRAGLVQDLTATNADLGVTLSATGAATTGTVTTYSAVVTNLGPANASSVSLTAFIPASGVLNSVSSTAGTCSTTGIVTCDLGSLSYGASATITFQVLQTTAGTATMSVQASGSENDPVLTNNQASSTLTITGGSFNLVPTLTSISPAVIASGSGNTNLTLTGAGFSSGSTVLLSGVPLPTSFNSSTSLTATVPANSLASLGWAPVTVSTPAPGGGTSSALPLTIFTALNLGANRMVFDPYSRNIMAGIGTGTSSVPANSLVAITPSTATVGTAVPLGITPTNLALTSDGQFLYALLPGASTGSIARFNMLSNQATVISGFQATGYNVGLRDIAAQPGTDNTIAVDQGEYPGTSLFDINPATNTATARGAATGLYTGTCLTFPNASILYINDLYSSGSYLGLYNVTSTGLTKGTGASLQGMNCFKVDGGLLYGQAGGIASATVAPPVQLGLIEGMPYVSNYSAGIKDFQPDTSLGISFYLTSTNANDYSAIFDSMTGFNITTFMPSSVLALPFTAIEGSSGFTGVDVVRWAQDGLAILTSSGHIYLLRGPAIVPQLLASNTAATLTAVSAPTIPHGSGNLTLTLTGSNFLPGVAVSWNGSYRTTTVVDSSHLSVAIPASDLAQTGTAAITAANPGAPASGSLSVTIN